MDTASHHYSVFNHDDTLTVHIWTVLSGWLFPERSWDVHSCKQTQGASHGLPMLHSISHRTAWILLLNSVSALNHDDVLVCHMWTNSYGDCLKSEAGMATLVDTEEENLMECPCCSAIPHRTAWILQLPIYALNHHT